MSDVSLAPIVAYAAATLKLCAPYAIAAAGAFLVAEIKRYTGVAISKDIEARVEKAIADEVGSLIAEAADNLATRAISLGSDEVNAIAERILAALPAELDQLGWSPADVAKKVHGAIGRVQASMTRVSPPAAPVAAKAA